VKTVNRSAALSLATVAAAGALCLSNPSRAFAQDAPAAPTAAAQQAPPPGDPLGPDVFLAIGAGKTAELKALLAKGAKVEAKNFLQATPLLWAAAVGNQEACAVLLDAGADLNAAAVFGNALSVAEMSGNQDLVRFLLDRGAKPDAERGDGITPVMTAAGAGHLEALRMLLARIPAAANQADAEGHTPLMHAARRGQTAAARLLLQAGAKPDAADHTGRTALMHAAQNGSAECAALLLGHKADVNARDKAGDTALLLAARYCREPSVVAALLRGGADASAKDARGRTAFDLALARRSPAAIALRRRTAVRNAATAAGPTLPAEARAAAERGLTLIERSTKTFSERAPCASCHHQGLGLTATGVAKASGLRIDSALAAAQTKLILDGDKAVGGSLAQVIDHPEMYKHVPGVDMGELAPMLTSVFAGLLEHGEKGGEVESQMAVVLASQQNPDGSWGFLLLREPMQSSRFTTTALAVRVLLALMPADRSEETARRVASAREWLKAAKATTGEDRAFRLLGLKWAGAGANEIAKAVAELKAAQRPDGGWAQLPAPVKPAPGAGDGMFTRSDAYATGQALYALAAGGSMPTTAEEFRRGIRFLLDTQDEDGSWLVTKRAAPVNTYFDAAFPHGQSQYSSYNATCWATMALSLAAAGPARPVAPVAAGSAKVSRR